jgi:hypothetical protein
VSSAWAGGSTRAWRELRRFVLDRDGWRCRMLEDDGHTCGRALRSNSSDPRHQATVQHLDPIGQGHALLPDPSRLVAACATHNSQEAARMTNAKRMEPSRGWSW